MSSSPRTFSGLRPSRRDLSASPLLAGVLAIALPWAPPAQAFPQGEGLAAAPAGAPTQPQPPAEPPLESAAIPQAVVQCKGAHALCNASIDCQRQGKDKALCPCWNVNETHLVLTSKIQDALVRQETQRRCTQGSPCGLEEAPVCRVIREGHYRVDKVTYPGVSTFSYRGWCQTFRPVACEAAKAPWADCMAAPCQKNPNNPDRPWTCQCRIQNSAFVGINGSCDSATGQVMSTFERPLWNFQTGAFSLPLPGNDFVNLGACRFLRSDP
ncbi:MAG: hypothetical protein ACK5N0_15085 [Synechococcaceae cyanobacterium]